MEDDIFYDMYGDDVEFDPYEEEGNDIWDEEDEGEHDIEALSFGHMVQDCLLPTFNDVTLPLAKLFLSCAVLRFFISLGFVSSSTRHVISIVTGSWLAYQFFQKSSVYLLTFTLATYVILRCSTSWMNRRAGYCVATFSIIYSLFCELVIADEKSWHTVRGANMVIVMKVVSLAFEMDSQTHSTLPPLLSYMGYCSTPSTIIFGPWINYSDYSKMMTQKCTENTFWVLKFLKCFFCSLLYLSIATCWSHWLFGYYDKSTLLPIVAKWIVAYGDALSYRCSHYFVSYLSECSTAVAGIHHDLKVAQPYHVEMPRSLVEVVIHWNFPMHFWLKTYVFKVVRAHSVVLAIFSTYAVSSLLHGLNFQLAAVLLSLGFHTYVEYEFRRKLSDIFSACVMARRCRSNCRHQYKTEHHWVRLANLCFTSLALFHLTYLGLMFDSNPSVEEKGYDMSHTLRKWGELGYASHWVAIFTFVFNILL